MTAARGPAAITEPSSRRCPARETYALDVPVVRAAAAAQHIALRVPAQQVAVLAAELDGITGIEIRRPDAEQGE